MPCTTSQKWEVLLAWVFSLKNPNQTLPLTAAHAHKPEHAHHQHDRPLGPGRNGNTQWHSPEIILLFRYFPRVNSCPGSLLQQVRCGHAASSICILQECRCCCAHTLPPCLEEGSVCRLASTIPPPHRSAGTMMCAPVTGFWGLNTGCQPSVLSCLSGLQSSLYLKLSLCRRR